MEQEEMRKGFIAEPVVSGEAVDERFEKEIDLIEKLKETPINLTEQGDDMTKERIRELAPDKRILFCDSYIKEMEDAERFGPGFVEDDILLIDHHLPIPEMSRQYSSTNLAIEFVNELGPVDKDVETFISHTDCDSILSSSIMRGIIDPKPEFGTAAIAADHTGEENAIADLLQSLNDYRDIELSIKSLQEFLKGEELNPVAKEALEERIKDRERAREAVQNDFKTTAEGRIAYASLSKKLDGGLLPALLPDAELILMFSPFIDKNTKEPVPGKLEAKVRLGKAAPDGTDLREIMSKVDPNWGGRWNAGANKRHGGTDMTEEEYISRLEKSISN